MPRYLFQIRINGGVAEDHGGADVAIEEATLTAREILAERVFAGDSVDGQEVEITTEDGAVVRTVTFRSAIRPLTDSGTPSA